MQLPANQYRDAPQPPQLEQPGFVGKINWVYQARDRDGPRIVIRMASWGSEDGSSDSHLESNDAIVSQLAQEDKVSWYRKPNLRLLYILMLPTCLGVEMTSGQVFSIHL